MSEINGERSTAQGKRPTTSGFVRGDRLPSRQVKTRAQKRVSINSRRNKSRAKIVTKQPSIVQPVA